jgi:hypothetical protein
MTGPVALTPAGRRRAGAAPPAGTARRMSQAIAFSAILAGAAAM